MNKKRLLNIKYCIVVLVIFSLVLPNIISCNKKVINNETKKPDDKIVADKLNLPRVMVTIKNKLEVRLDNVSIIRAIKINNGLDNASYQDSYIYLSKSKTDTRIVKIKKDGTTLDTIIEGKDSLIYPNAYIVEKGGDLAKTNAKYLLDAEKFVIVPKSTDKVFAAVNFTIKNISRKKILLKDLKLSLITNNKIETDLDLIFTDIVLDESFMPDLEPNNTYNVRLLTLIPVDSEQIIFRCESEQIKWEKEKLP